MPNLDAGEPDVPEPGARESFQDRENRSARALSWLVRQAEGGKIGALGALADELDEAVFVVDQERNVVLFNHAAEAITGYQRREVLGRHCLTGIKCTRCLQSCGIFERGHIRGVPLDLIRKDGSTVAVTKSASVLRDAAGEVIGAIEVLRKLPSAEGANGGANGTDGANASANAEVLEGSSPAWAGLETVLSSLGRSFVLLDRDFNIQRASTSFAQMLGTVAGALAGRPASQVFGPDLCAPESPFRTGLESGERREGWRALAQRADGIELPLSVTGAPLLEAQQCDGEGSFTSRYVVVARPEEQVEERSGSSTEGMVFEGMISRSAAMRRIFQLVSHLYDSDVSVLITGESGTGKELLARAVHARSVRANQPFVAVNCGALPANLLESELFGHARGSFTGAIRDVAGRFEVVGEGTLFLDEIGDLPLALQVKLLRVLQDRNFERVGETKSRSFRGRIVAATNQDLGRMVAEKRFREDLYYRLNVVPLHLPPLRERREDVELLITHLLDKKGRSRSRALRLSPSAMRILMSHEWPGNVRQLENALEYATAVCEGQTIHPDDLPAELASEAGRPVLPARHPHVPGRHPDVPARQHPVRTAALPSPAASAAVATPPDSPRTDAGASAPGRAHRTPSAVDLSDATVLSALERARWNRAEAARLLGISRTTLWRRLKQIPL